MKKLKLITLLIFLTYGCVEHLFFIRIYPAGQTEIRIRSSGDSTDIYDSDFLHPADSSIWKTTFSIDSSEQDLLWIKETKGFIEAENTALPGGNRYGVQTYPLNVSVTKGWVTTTYTFNQTFNGREMFTKVPQLGDAIRKNIANDSTQWMTESFSYIIRKSLQDLHSDPELASPYGMEDRLLTHFNNYLTRVDHEELYAELATNKLRLLYTILSPFEKDLPTDYIPKLAAAMNPYEEDIRITAGLQDDQFGLALIMPGRIVDTNADTLVGDTLKWTFGLTDFLNDSFSLQASSMVISTTMFQKTVVITTLLLAGMFFLMWYRKR